MVESSAREDCHVSVLGTSPAQRQLASLLIIIQHFLTCIALFSFVASFAEAIYWLGPSLLSFRTHLFFLLCLALSFGLSAAPRMFPEVILSQVLFL
jgi:hypothetical protein